MQPNRTMWAGSEHFVMRSRWYQLLAVVAETIFDAPNSSHFSPPISNIYYHTTAPVAIMLFSFTHLRCVLLFVLAYVLENPRGGFNCGNATLAYIWLASHIDLTLSKLLEKKKTQ